MERPFAFPSSVLSQPFLFLFSFLLHCFDLSQAQQTYLRQKNLDCYNYTNDASVNGYLCNGLANSCVSYLTYTATSIGYLLQVDATEIAKINGITVVDEIPTDTLVIIPANCSCSGQFFQHSSSYVLDSYSLRDKKETYFSVANRTFQGLTTCQALMKQNHYDSYNLSVGLSLTIPLRCACPTGNQTANGVKYLLTYPIAAGDSVHSIGETFQVDEQSINDANELTKDDIIYYWSPILVPLKTQPTIITKSSSPPPLESPEGPAVISESFCSVRIAIRY